jgi:hypothetical protein
MDSGTQPMGATYRHAEQEAELRLCRPLGAARVPRFAVVLLAIDAATLVHTARFVRGGGTRHRNGIDLESRTSDGDIAYPVVRFTTAEGRAVELTSSSGSSSPPEVGDRRGSV